MDKSLQIVFRDMEHSEALDRAIRDRAAKLERFNAHITACRVVVEIPHCAAHAGKKPLAVVVEVEVPNRSMIVAKFEEDRHDMKGSQTVVVNRAFDAVQRQLEEIADIRQGHVKKHEAGLEGGTEPFPT